MNDWEINLSGLGDKLVIKEIGKEIGKKEGEKNKAIEVARKSLEAGLDINTISSITGLDISEIEKLFLY